MDKNTFTTTASALTQSAEKLNELAAKKESNVGLVNLNGHIAEFVEGGNKLLNDSDILRIGIVGQVKAGKSSFLNSLFFDGQSVLPKASTPMTAGLTILEYGDYKRIYIEYYNTEEWQAVVERADSFKQRKIEMAKNMPQLSDFEIERQIGDDVGKSAKELVERCGRDARSKISHTNLIEELAFDSYGNMQSILENYVGSNGNFTSVVKSLKICVDDPRLKGIQVVDTPGVNDPIVSRENRTREFLQTCHGVFFLSYAGQFFSGVDSSFLTNRIDKTGIGSVVVLASKFDSVIQDEGTKYHNRLEDAWNTCENTLKQRFDEILRSMGPRKILFDVVSGISYSIAIKDQSQWDSIENHVVLQFKNFFPKYFEDGANTKDLFMELSGIEHIKSRFLKGEFASRKTEIISEKLDKYFKEQTSYVKEKIECQINNFTKHIETLKSTDLDIIRTRKSTCEDTVNSLAEVFEKELSVALSNLEAQTTEVFNENYLSWSQNVPTEQSSKKIVATDTWANRNIVGDLKNDSVTVSYETPNTAELRRQLENLTESYFKKIAESWKRMTSAIRNRLRDRLFDCLAQQEKATMNINISNKDFERIIVEELDKVSNKSVLNLEKLRSSSNELIQSMCNSQGMRFEPKGSYDVRKENVANTVQDEYSYFINTKVLPRLYKCIDNIRADVHKVTDKSQDDLKELFGSIRSTLKEDLRSKFTKVLAELEAEIENKERSILENEAIINVLNQLNSVIKNG